jgi:hypothetical protein
MTQDTLAIDHLVLPVTDIALARERLGKLGFTVAPDARHPFGTENACVFFADRSYLEPLGVASVEESDRTARDGNVFTARDQAFRFRCGSEGLSAIAFSAADAKHEHARFVKGGISAGSVLQFERPVKMPDGTESIAGFRLAFAGDLRAPDFFLFAVERVNPLPADRSALEAHVNGVTGIAEIVLAAPEPSAFGEFVRGVARADAADETGFGVRVPLANTKISLMNPAGLEAYFDLATPDTDRGLRGRAILFHAGDLAVTEAHLAANGVTYTRKGNRILVKPAPGQGVLFAFEETS